MSGTDDFDNEFEEAGNELQANDGLQDDVDFDDNDDGFGGFDQPEGSENGQSLGDLWRNNPIIKIAVVVIGVVVVLGALLLFSGGEDDLESNVGTALQQREAPGAETSEAYREAIDEVNQQRYEEALRSGTSTIPIPVASQDDNILQPVDQEPPVQIEDPLADWRASAQNDTPTQVVDPLAADAVIGGQQQLQFQQQMLNQPMGPDPAAVDALAQAMAGQMQSILDRHQIAGSQVMDVTSRDYFKVEEDSAVSGEGVTTAEEEIEEILIPAGTILYAQTLTEANTDAPGPVLARLASGPISGSRLIGSFDKTDKFLILSFDTVVVDGVSQSIDAIALDPKTTLPAVATEVDRRYFQRIILPAAARFVQGMGDAIAQREQTNVSVNGSTVTSSTPDLNTREELAAGFSEATQELADEFEEQSDAVEVLIKVHAGTSIGILFLEPVIRQ